MKQIVSLVFLLMCVVVLVGCERKPSEPGAPVEIAKASPVANTPQVVAPSVIPATSVELKLPEDFPADVLIYPGARITQSTGTAEYARVRLESKDPTSSIIRKYKTEMASLGWEVVSESAMGGNMEIKYLKGEKSSIVQISQEDQNTFIAILVGSLKR